MRGEGLCGDLMEKTILRKKAYFSTNCNGILVPIVGQNAKLHSTEVCFRTLSFLAIFI